MRLKITKKRSDHVPEKQNQQAQQKHKNGNAVNAVHKAQVEIGIFFLFRLFEQRKRVEVIQELA